MSSMAHSAKPLEPVSSSVASAATALYDLVCIGFGPAQLATAIANRETKPPSSVLFLERKPSFSWHSGKHGARARLEGPFIYDLATLRNPRSAFSYANYLLARNRLIEFANSDRLNPLRIEFEDYLKWCAEHFKDQVRYSSEVVKVVPILSGDVVSAWQVAVRDENGAVSFFRAKSILAPSPASSNRSRMPPPVPVDFLAGERIISMDDYQSRRNELRGTAEPRLNVAVMGAGQRTAEIVDDLLSCPRLGNITLVTEDESLVPLQALAEQEPARPQLCSIWAKPSGNQKASIPEASELVQTIYMRAYEKQVASRGQYTLRVVVGKEAAERCSLAHFIIRDTRDDASLSTGLLQSLDKLALGCRPKGDSLEEVQFKRDAVDAGCRVFLMSANTEGGRSLAKDIAVMAGHVVKLVSQKVETRRDDVIAQARM
ncbi:L-ornithine N(5)-monooxygenase [Parastagonospora nodorum]|nr:L-ornithine N(5)-monooxygenase [Parastagonospora nodorum]KAH4955032.1 L-ornithine N(5)-monooxygenase [Parastagonospora nodorum]KAH4979455.1 L-ornithine N(5)-monooxygenase [Parastagonospora nodorum]KAH5102742.1 L-ornithine N(5)-monooxygenase [Parastagonospora nodorum]KAH5173568.1 L-ornithine N(5)-monooxygenase [Parastagonospora nodorum]